MYELGGYRPVVIDDLLQYHYRIVDKLGFDGYSTTWLARDEMCKRYVAFQIGLSNVPIPRRELQILKAFNSCSRSSLQETHPPDDAGTASPLLTILDAFDVRGPNGTHLC